MGAAGFHGRVRDGIGWDTRAVTTGSAGRRVPGARLLARTGRSIGLAACLSPTRGSLGAAVTVCLGRRGMLRDRSAWVPGRSLGWGRMRSIGRLVSVSCMHCCTSTSDLSTWWSATALIGRRCFKVGFPLRCFQRLSLPDLATRLRGWRHDRPTRGLSIPVLSY